MNERTLIGMRCTYKSPSKCGGYSIYFKSETEAVRLVTSAEYAAYWKKGQRYTLVVGGLEQ